MSKAGSNNPKWKGGRTAPIFVKVTPATKARLHELIIGRGDKTMADTIDYLIISEHKMMKQGGYIPLPTPTPAPLDGEEGS